jgi:flagellar biosynthesis GTPase FlhF
MTIEDNDRLKFKSMFKAKLNKSREKKQETKEHDEEEKLELDEEENDEMSEIVSEEDESEIESEEKSELDEEQEEDEQSEEEESEWTEEDEKDFQFKLSELEKFVRLHYYFEQNKPVKSTCIEYMERCFGDKNLDIIGDVIHETKYKHQSEVIEKVWYILLEILGAEIATFELTQDIVLELYEQKDLKSDTIVNLILKNIKLPTSLHSNTWFINNVYKWLPRNKITKIKFLINTF